MDRLCRALCTVHSISAQISQEGIKYTKVKELPRSYCPKLYTVDSVQNNQTLLKKNEKPFTCLWASCSSDFVSGKKEGTFPGSISEEDFHQRKNQSPCNKALHWALFI